MPRHESVTPGARRDPISLGMQGGEWYNAPRTAYDGGSYGWELDELESMNVVYRKGCVPRLLLFSTCRLCTFPSRKRILILRRTMIPTTASWKMRTIPTYNQRRRGC